MTRDSLSRLRTPGGGLSPGNQLNCCQCAQEPQAAPHKGRGNGRNGNRGWGGRRGGAPPKGVPGKRRRDEDGLLIAASAGAPRYVAKAQV